MNVWRFGSNWDEENILPLFKKHNIAFAGPEVEHRVTGVKSGDLIAVTDGKQIVAVGKVSSLVALSSISENYVQKYASVTAIQAEHLFFYDQYNLDFSYYDGRGKQFHEAHGGYRTHIIDLYNKLNSLQMHKGIQDLLLYKKQIIFQGPPGTGKTRMAKEIANTMCLPTAISNDQIQRTIVPNLVVRSAKDYVNYTVVSLEDLRIKMKNESSTEVFSNYTDIINAYKNKSWEGILENGLQSYAAALAKYVYNNLKNENIKLIQFHPAYSYEDFVRGITAEVNGTQIEYKPKDKTLGKFALQAYSNYVDSRKETALVSKEITSNKAFEDFVDSTQEELDINGKVWLTKSVYIYEIVDDAFLYKGDIWGSSQRLPFTELLKLYNLNISDIKSIKTNTETSGSAKQHSGYYFSILQKFREFLAGKAYAPAPEEKIAEQKYVLIIDEINRANLPAVLGELIYALEYRGDKVESMYDIDGDKSLVLPPNLLIIGTMNTADRSVGHIDYAIRRRFAFVDVLPTMQPIRDAGKEYFKKVSSLFIKNIDAVVNGSNQILESSDYLAADFRPEDVWLGHSYFITKEKDENGQPLDEVAQMKIKLRFEIAPLLKEYVKDGILYPTAQKTIDELLKATQ